jgi:putative cell wall-binding protein
MKHLFNKQGESIMFTKLGRTAGAIVAGSAAVAMAVVMAPAASAVTPNSNNFIPSVLSATTYRVAGSDRIATAIKAAQTRISWGSFNTQNPPVWVNGCDVILARSDNYPDALVSGPLAASRHAPILLNPTAALDDRVKAEIQILAGQCSNDNQNQNQLKVTIVGGNAAISDTVATTLLGQGYYVERLQGPDRYQTAVAVGDAVNADYGKNGIHDTNVFLATGENFPDSLAAGATASQKNGIVLLTNGTAMNPFTSADIAKINTDVTYWGFTPTVYAVGGPAAAASPDSISYIGVDRYQTASKLADAFFQFIPSTMGRVQNVGVASGENFPDAMVAGGFMANSNGPLLLTQQASLNGFTSAYLYSQRDWVNNAFVFGGPVAVAPGVASQVTDALFN